MSLVDWRLCVVCYYPTTPTEHPSTTRGTSVCSAVAVNIDFYGYIKFFSISLVWTVWVQYATENISGHQLVFGSQASVDISTHSGLQCNQYTKRAVSGAVLVSWDKIRSCYVLTYKSGYLEGFRRWRGSILAPHRNPDLQGSCSLAKLSIVLDRNE
jgi:hypothetical protein